MDEVGVDDYIPCLPPQTCTDRDSQFYIIPYTSKTILLLNMNWEPHFLKFLFRGPIAIIFKAYNLVRKLQLHVYNKFYRLKFGNIQDLSREGGGASEILPLQKRGAKKVLDMLKGGGGGKKF